MAGLIARLKQRREPDPYDPHLAGIGGYGEGPGPAGENGFPGSTSATRTLRGAGPREAKVESDTNTGFDQGFEGTQVFRGGRTWSEGHRNPRDTPFTPTPQPRAVGSLRRNPGEWFGGLPMRSDQVAPADHVIGANPLEGAAAAGGHSTYDTETPRTSRQPDISGSVPGSANVRNEYAQRYRNPPGQLHSYASAPRHDVPRGQLAEPGNGGGRRGFSVPVMVPSRWLWPGGGVQTWSVQRQMPYSGRGDGARGADLNGTRYYESGPPVAVNAGLGAYGVARLRGPNHRPVSFTEPAPWSAQYYDTTASVGTTEAPGPGGQAPGAVYTSPDLGRGGLVNPTGRA